jgi:hypothetical protein
LRFHLPIEGGLDDLFGDRLDQPIGAAQIVTSCASGLDQVAQAMYDSRLHNIAAIGRVVGVSRASVYRALGQTNVEGLSS